MNYLVHAYFSGEKDATLTGNMIGDFVKGSSILDSFEPSLRNGILLHRAIDSYSDQHLAVAKAKNFFRNEYRLYSGAFVDVVFDHFFANDPQFFPDEKSHKDFTLKVYNVLNINTAFLPEPFARMLPFMEKDNWLYTVRNMKGLETAFHRLVRRMEHEDDGGPAYNISVKHYYELNQIYYEFIDDFEKFVKAKLISMENAE